MYKGDTKKWQVLNDQAFDWEEISKVQAAIKAPSPDQLDHNKKITKKTVSLPFTNHNVEKWRDDAYFNDSADFSSQMLDYERDRQTQFFLDRYAKTKEISEH